VNKALDATSLAALDHAEEQLRALQRTLKTVRAPASDPLRDYSLGRAIAWRAGKIVERKAAFESFVHDEFVRAGHKPSGNRSVFIPPGVLTRYFPSARASQPYQTTVTGSGAELVETTLRNDLFIDALRPKSLVLQLGATVIPGLVGDVQIPRMDTASSAYWLLPSGSPVESGAITESEGTFDPTPLDVVPCMVGGYGRISRLLLQQSALADVVIANDMMNVLATALDVAAIQGPGTGGSPTGISNTSGINAVTGTVAGALEIMQDAVGTALLANAVVNRQALGWAAPISIASQMMGQSLSTNGSLPYAWTGGMDQGLFMGTRAMSSNNVPANTMIFADWSQLLILRWGDPDQPIEVEVSAFGTGFASGDVEIRAMMSCNTAVRHPQSFSVVTGLT
jgi:HK97 family phage major capsid protein